MILRQDSLTASNLDKKSSRFVPFLATREWRSDKTMLILKSHPGKENKREDIKRLKKKKKKKMNLASIIKFSPLLLLNLNLTFLAMILERLFKQPTNH